MKSADKNPLSLHALRNLIGSEFELENSCGFYDVNYYEGEADETEDNLVIFTNQNNSEDFIIANVESIFHTKSAILVTDLDKQDYTFVLIKRVTTFFDDIEKALR